MEPTQESVWYWLGMLCCAAGLTDEGFDYVETDGTHSSLFNYESGLDDFEWETSMRHGGPALF